MNVLGAYRRVFANPALARLMFGEFVSSVGDWLYLVALLIVVYAESSDPVVLGIVGAARIVPYVLLSVPAGIAADRFDRRLILIVTDLARGAIMVLIAVSVGTGQPVVVTVALAILATCFSAFFSPAIGAYLPSLVRDESELGPANSAWSSLDNLAFFIGPAVAAALIAGGGLVVAFVLNAFSFAVVAAVLWRLPRRARRAADEGDAATPAEPTPSGETAAPETKPVASVRTLARPLSGLVVIDVAESFVFGGLGVLTVVIAVDALNADESATGLLNAAVGVGGIVGALIAGVLVLRRQLAPPLLGGALVVGVSLWALGATGALTVALLAMAAAAVGSLLIEIVATTLLQRIVPDEVRGRTLGVLQTISVLAYAAGSFVLPISAVAVGLPEVMTASGVVMAVAALLGVVLLGPYAIQEPAADPVRRRLAEVPLFAGLSPARLETAMRRAVPVPMQAGDVVIRQGDEADRFYVIAEGTVEVTQQEPGAERRVLRQLGPGDFFGEIGLLTGVPRTATVTAVDAGTLLALDREPFLELVSSAEPGLTYRLLDLYRGVALRSS